MTATPTPSKPRCRICGHESHFLGTHLLEAHGLTVKEYLAAYPGSPTVSDDAMKAWESRASASLRRAHPPIPQNLRVEVGGFKVPVRAGVAAKFCLPMPSEYRFPQHGLLATDMLEAAIAVLSGRHTYIYGMPGSGKDAFLHAVSAMTRRPAIIRTVTPTTDVEAWLFVRSFDQKGTSWETQQMFHALTEGFLTETGERIPYMILISDFDRATKSQAEFLRLIIDSISGRVQGPGGTVYDLFPGTQIVATANTSGGGDTRGRMVSANPIDGSIMDRFERVFEFHWMEWRDEEPICKAKFPLLDQEVPAVFTQLGKATAAVRKAIYDEKLYAEFSHRAVCNILGHCQDIISLTGEVPKDLLKRGIRAWADGLPDEHSKAEAIKLMDPHIQGGVVGSGSSTRTGTKLGGF